MGGYFQDVASASGQEADSLRDVAGEAMSRCEAALRALVAGNAQAPSSSTSGGTSGGDDASRGGSGFLGSGPGGGGLATANALFGWAEQQLRGGQRR